MTASGPRLVQAIPHGPVMVQGPVRIELPDGSVVESDRFMVAICACRRSQISAVRHQPSAPVPGPMRQLSGRRSDPDRCAAAARWATGDGQPTGYEPPQAARRASSIMAYGLVARCFSAAPGGLSRSG